MHGNPSSKVFMKNKNLYMTITGYYLEGGGEGCMEKADRFQGLYWIQVGMEYIYELRLDMITV